VRASTEAAQVLSQSRSVLLPLVEGAVMLYCSTSVPKNTDAIVGRALLSFWHSGAQTARTEGLMARAEMLTAALDTLGHRLSDAQSLAASQCEPVSLDDKVIAERALHLHCKVCV
jgi:hypothetical protein